LQTAVRRKATRKFRLRLSYRRKVQMLLIAPLSDTGDFRVINLDFVVDLVDGQSRAGFSREEQRDGRNKPDTKAHIHLRNLCPVTYHLANHFAQYRCLPVKYWRDWAGVTRLLQALADPWRPWRAVAARILWTYDRHGSRNKSQNRPPPSGRDREQSRPPNRIAEQTRRASPSGASVDNAPCVSLSANSSLQ
jgi:hypothetical protein